MLLLYKALQKNVLLKYMRTQHRIHSQSLCYHGLVLSCAVLNENVSQTVRYLVAFILKLNIVTLLF